MLPEGFSMPRFPHRIAVGLIALATLTLQGRPLHAQGARDNSQQAHDSTQMTPLPQGELDVVKVLLAQERAWNEGNIEAFASGYKRSPDTIFIGAAIFHGFDAMLDRYKKSYPDRATMGTLTFSDLQPRILDDHFAIVTGQFALDRDKKHGGPAGGIFSLVFEKTPGGWKIVLDHTT
jgi:ketosteroid isomerase-like protein